VKAKATEHQPQLDIAFRTSKRSGGVFVLAGSFRAKEQVF
jgi:hypothetical protein